MPPESSSAWTCVRPTNRIESPEKNHIRRVQPTLEKSPARPPKGKYVLRLFVAGATARSRQAVLIARQLCATNLAGACKLEVVDIYQQPALARAHQIIATPTLIKELPRPVRRFIGNLASLDNLFDEPAVITQDRSAQ